MSSGRGILLRRPGSGRDAGAGETLSKTIDEGLVRAEEEILARKGAVVIRLASQQLHGGRFRLLSLRGEAKTRS